MGSSLRSRRGPATASVEAAGSQSAVELPAVLDNRARRRAGAAAALGRAVAHTALKNGAARSATSAAIVGAPFFTTHTARTAIPDHVVRDPRTRAAEPWPDPGALPVGVQTGYMGDR